MSSINLYRPFCFSFLVSVSCAFTNATSVLAASFYTFTDLGTLPGDVESIAYSLNNKGQVVGASSGGGSESSGFVWDSEKGMTSLGSLPNTAKSINDVGQVVGDFSQNSSTRAFLWDESSGMQNLGTLPGGVFSTANKINEIGDIAGSSLLPSISGEVARATIWSGEQVIDLGTLPGRQHSYASSINDFGEVVGYAGDSNTGLTSFFWNVQNGILDLSILFDGAENVAWDVNNNLTIVGIKKASVVEGQELNERIRGFQFINGFEVLELGVLSGDANSFANAVNNLNQVVGSSQGSTLRAFLWEPQAAKIQDLNTLIDPSLGWSLSEALDINDSGQIVGYGVAPDGGTRGFLLTPSSDADNPSVPEPSFLFGLVGIGIPFLRKHELIDKLK